MSIIVEAIRNLTPEAEFSYKDEDLTTLEWQSENIKQPTIAAIEKEIAKVILVKETEATTKEAAKAALLTKLGITADEAALLLS
jgi:hypothetical protein